MSLDSQRKNEKAYQEEPRKLKLTNQLFNSNQKEIRLIARTTNMTINVAMYKSECVVKLRMDP